MSFKRIKTFSFNFQENGQERKRKENTKYYYITNFELKSNLENVISLQFRECNLIAFFAFLYFKELFWYRPVT